jgi:hypothetical protein
LAVASTGLVLRERAKLIAHAGFGQQSDQNIEWSRTTT